MLRAGTATDVEARRLAATAGMKWMAPQLSNFQVVAAEMRIWQSHVQN